MFQLFNTFLTHLVVKIDSRMVMFGFMVTTAFVSMFISNAATTAMMLPIVEAFAIVMDVPEPEVGHQTKMFIQVFGIDEIHTSCQFISNW